MTIHDSDILTTVVGYLRSSTACSLMSIRTSTFVSHLRLQVYVLMNWLISRHCDSILIVLIVSSRYERWSDNEELAGKDHTCGIALRCVLRRCPRVVEWTISLVPACLRYTKTADTTAYERRIQWDTKIWLMDLSHLVGMRMTSTYESRRSNETPRCIFWILLASRWCRDDSNIRMSLIPPYVDTRLCQQALAWLMVNHEVVTLHDI
jgi:hypothetical protein